MRTNPITCAFSTCPNDTFIFGRMAQDEDLEVHLHDVETLNREAFSGRYDITKLSFHAWLKVQEQYQLLDAGAALGRGCGPLVICKEDVEPPGGQVIPHLRRCGIIAVPGEYTTANLLLQLWNPQIENRLFMPFDRIMDAVESGRADAGVIIHEGRFVFEERGFRCLQDLGDWWEQETGLPIPLGCIAVRKSLGTEKIEEIGQRLRQSIHYAFDDPDAVSEYVRAHAQELDEEVIRRHIETYVNQFTLELGKEGYAAVERLQELARKAGVIE
jgi:1,4-dihydroxy-6-naphthoate synthase